ncbi:MAG TPA: MFS transporter [Myxococcales bacterium]|nr:MFS transporter [Myxococcales bacterium]
MAESGSATAAERPGRTIVDAAARAIHAQPGELKAVLLSFAYFFFLLSSYYILRPLRDEMGVAGGVQKLPWLFTGTFLAMLAAVPAFSAVAARVPRHRFIPLSYRFFTANIVLFWALFATGTFRVGAARAFFIWTSVYNLFVVSVFWSFMADIFRHEQGTRLYGFIAAGGSAGALAGPLLTTFLVKPLGPTNLLLVSALLLEATVQCVRALHRWSTTERRDERRERAAEQPLGGSFISGIRVVFQSRFLLLICAYVLLLTATATFLYLEQAQIVAHASTDPRVRTALFARIDLVVNVLTLLIQGFVTGRLLRRFGVGVGLALLPILTVGGFVALAALPTVLVITVVQGIRRAAHFAIERPAREILFIDVPREQKYKSKNFIDTVVYRGGDAVTAWLSSALQALGLGIVPISALAVALSGVWLWNSLSLARKDEAAAS